MITREQLAIYKKYGGDVDGFAYAGTSDGGQSYFG